MKSWNLIIDQTPHKGAWNMAADEFLFRTLDEAPQTFVRFYCWERPTVSLGYSQSADKALDLDYCRHHGIDVVRRITGGKLVLHWRELTYSVCSSDTQAFSDRLAKSYRLISESLIRGLEKMSVQARLAGPPPGSYRKGNVICFSHPARDEIEAGGWKLVGSAQKRVGARFLQHGSIPLQAGKEILRRVSLCENELTRTRLTSLSEVLGRDVGFAEAASRLVEGMAEYFRVKFRPLRWTAADLESICRIQKNRYEDARWTAGQEGTAGLDFFPSRWYDFSSEEVER
ncbi:MAG: lipoate--protein ligase family protein [Acidobacteriota bacterium]